MIIRYNHAVDIMGKKTKISFFTMIIYLINALISAVFGLIYNNLVIREYGSQVNGLISTLTQFVSMFSVIEGGFTTAAVIAVYRPLISKEYDKLNNILYTAKKIYIRIGFIIMLSVLIGGSVYIRFIESPFSYLQTFTLLMICVSVTAVSFGVQSAYSILMQGDNKEYLMVLFSLLARTISWMIMMLLVINSYSIILVYAINILNIVLNIIFIRCYERKKYPYITYKGSYEKGLIKGTGDIFLQKISNLLFTSTDLVLISLFINLSAASVYNLYFQIFGMVFNLLASICQAPFHSFGQLATTEDGKKNMHSIFKVYQHIILVLANFCFATIGVLIIPFLKIYTAKITDYNYIYSTLVLLFYSQMFAQIVNRPYGTIINTTGNFKLQNKQCVIAAIVNIIVSVAFIKWWGIHSIVLGSLVGTLVIVIMNVWKVYQNIFKGSCLVDLKNIIVNYVLGLVIIICSWNLPGTPLDYMQLFLYSVFAVIASLTIVVIVNFVFCYRDMVCTVRFCMKNFLKKDWKGFK